MSEGEFGQQTRKRVLILSRLEETVGEMNRRGYRARTVALKLRTRDFTTNTRAHTLKEPTASLDTIWQTALRILSGYSIEKKLRLIGIRISNLEKVPKASRNS